MAEAVTYLGIEFRVGTNEQIRQAISEAKVVYVNKHFVYCTDKIGTMYISPRSAHPPVMRQGKD